MYENATALPQISSPGAGMRTVRPGDLEQNQTRPSSPLNEVRQMVLDANARIESMVAHARVISDELSGPLPPSPSGTVGREVPPKLQGLVPEIREQLMALHGRLSVLDDQLHRLAQA